MWAGSGNKLHILWQCLSARDVWSMGNKKLQNSATIGLCFPEVIENLFDKCSQEDMVQFAGLARRIWQGGSGLGEMSSSLTFTQ
jgi:hypothetical protein